MGVYQRKLSDQRNANKVSLAIENAMYYIIEQLVTAVAGAEKKEEQNDLFQESARVLKIHWVCSV